MTRLRALHQRLLDEDDGLSSLELAVLAPAVLLLITLGVAAGRITEAHTAVAHAAAVAARDASLQRTAGTAHTAAVSAANSELTGSHLKCSDITVDVNTAGFAKRPGTPATVTVNVDCVVNFADLTLPGLPGTKTVTAQAISPIDTYRER